MFESDGRFFDKVDGDTPDPAHPRDGSVDLVEMKPPREDTDHPVMGEWHEIARWRDCDTVAPPPDAVPEDVLAHFAIKVD